MKPTLAFGLVLALGCAPIDVKSEVSHHPRQDLPPAIGLQQLSGRDFVVEWVQLGPRLLVELREHRTCVGVRHVPVLRIEQITRTTRGFVAWDFVLGAASGGFAAVAFAQPQLFSPRLIDDQGRVVHDYTSAYVIGGLFATLSAGLIAAGVVNSLKARDETRYADAFEVELGSETACAGAETTGLAVADRSVRLRIDALELKLDGQTDASGRARFELPAWTEPIPASGEVTVIVEIDDELIGLSLRVPYDAMIEAHTGIVDTRPPATPPPAIEGPVQLESP